MIAVERDREMMLVGRVQRRTFIQLKTRKQENSKKNRQYDTCRIII